MFAKQLIASTAESVALAEHDAPIVDAPLALQLLHRQAGFAQWKIVFPGSAVLSPGVCAILGLPTRETPLPLPEMVECYHEEDRGKLLYLIAQALEGRRGFHCRLRVVQPDGTVRMAESYADLRIHDGRVTELFGLTRDVTATLERESAGLARTRMAQDIIAQMPAPIAVLDDKLRIVDCNKFWLKCHRQIDRKDVVGRSYNQLFPDAPAEVRTEFMRGLRGEVVQTKRKLVSGSTQQPMTCSAVIAPWFVGGDKIGGVTIMIGWSEFGMVASAPAPAPQDNAPTFDGSLLDLAKQVG
ncbi:PAS domain-containing protein [Devosia sp.]|uniref:PAS domain-containing protein n=1 Tax=Devosia sp. TaxID=1871048 RepID=UPI003A935E50